MINHFRTLILNLPPLGERGPRFSQYVPASFKPIHLDGVESSFRHAIFGDNSERERDEFISTMMFRLAMDFEPTGRIIEGIDPRVSFNHRDSIISQFDSDSLTYLVREPLTLDSIELSLSGDTLTMEVKKSLLDPLPLVPTISQLWSRVGSMPGFRTLYSSTGVFADVLNDLSYLVDTLKRDDHRLATAACAYCLRLTERL
jgi:hypothetical protein